MAPKRKRRGRPPGRSKGATFSTRITTETRALLDAASAASGKTLSQEIEERLQWSFKSAGVRSGLDKQPDHVQALAVFVAMLTEKIEAARLTEKIEAARGLAWREDEGVREAIMAGLETIFAFFHHGGIPTSWREMLPWYRSIVADKKSIHGSFGAVTAAGLIRNMVTGERRYGLTDADAARLAWVREKLGIQNPRDWGELLRVAREELETPTEPKDEETKS